MKYIIIIMVSCFSLYSCKKTPPKHEVTFEQQQERIRLDSLYLLYDSMPPRFDIKDFNQKIGDNEFYIFYDDDSLYIKQSFSGNHFYEDRHTRFLIERFKYDSLGIIQERYSELYDGQLYGKYFKYNQAGKLINVTDRFSDFTFTLESINSFVDSMKIRTYGMTLNLKYDTISNQYYWDLYERTSYYMSKEFYLDVSTGELLNYFEYDYEMFY